MASLQSPRFSFALIANKQLSNPYFSIRRKYEGIPMFSEQRS
jgi:hypothetical protein